MIKSAVLLHLLLLLQVALFAQAANEKIMFVVDSIPVINDPEPGNEILPGDIADLTVIKNKDTLNRLGYGKFDGCTFIFTKAYRNRPDSLKLIPTIRKMEQRNGVWLFQGVPYTGRIIDYYYSGKKQGEGAFVNGKTSGPRNIYYQNGKLQVEKNYSDGLENGWSKEYYEDGTLSQQGEYKEGKEQGIWENYFPNGQVSLRSSYNQGAIFDTATKYYSNGKIKEKVFIKGDEVTPDPSLAKIEQLMLKSKKSNQAGDSKEAILYCTKAIDLDSNYAAAYFTRGTIKLNEFQFDDAIADFDKALQIEPYMDIALANRAFARIRKYQFGDSRVLQKNTDVTVLASKDKTPIPANEQEKICADLKQALFLGDKSEMIYEALSGNCQASVPVSK